jgi:hypothetical protein
MNQNFENNYFQDYMELNDYEFKRWKYLHKQIILPNSEYSNKLKQAINKELLAR